MRERFAQIAESYVGTRQMHQGRMPGVGLDCIGVVVSALRELGHEPEDWLGYGERPRESDLMPRLEACAALKRVIRAPRRGDVVAYRWPQRLRHVGVCVGDNRVVRADAARGQIVITALHTSKIGAVFEVEV